jgi:hypothetical protein
MKRRMKPALLAIYLGILATLTFSGCSAESSSPLQTLATSGDIAPKARDVCTRYQNNLQYLQAASDSTGDGVREMARSQRDLADGFEVGLPDGDAYVAICIFSADAVPDMRDQYDHVALWIAGDKEPRGQGLLSWW